MPGWAFSSLPSSLSPLQYVKAQACERCTLAKLPLIDGIANNNIKDFP
jgi:hypothetical protein